MVRRVAPHNKCWGFSHAELSAVHRSRCGGVLHVVTHDRRRFLVDPPARSCLRAAIRAVRASFPFEMPAVVVLPDHLHAIWILPPGDSAYAMRWRRIKSLFTRKYLADGGAEGPRSASRLSRDERAVWQRRFWEHTIADDSDFDAHLDYIHYNPVKHGLVDCPGDWAYSSFSKWVDREVYPPDWGCSSRPPPRSILGLDDTAME